MRNKLFACLLLFVLYLFIVSCVSIALTLSDKKRAREHRRRISEKTLLLWGFAGGALPMLLTMKKIRHKTLHKKFMVGLPLEMTLHFLIAAFLFWLLIY